MCHLLVEKGYNSTSSFVSCRIFKPITAFEKKKLLSKKVIFIGSPNWCNMLYLYLPLKFYSNLHFKTIFSTTQRFKEPHFQRDECSFNYAVLFAVIKNQQCMLSRSYWQPECRWLSPHSRPSVPLGCWRSLLVVCRASH